MAKVSFTKLGLSKNQGVKNVQWGDYIVEVKQYLPINEKLILISNVLNNSHDDNNFANPVKVNVYMALEIIYAYTNINFTAKQREDVTKLYDLIDGSGLLATIIEAIPTVEYKTLMEGIHSTINAFYNYRNSIMGILDTLKTDYSALDFDATEIQQKLADPENMALLKDVLAKLG